VHSRRCGLFVCKLCKNVWTDLDAVWSEDSEAQGRKHVLDRGPDRSRWRCDLGGGAMWPMFSELTRNAQLWLKTCDAVISWPARPWNASSLIKMVTENGMLSRSDCPTYSYCRSLLTLSSLLQCVMCKTVPFCAFFITFIIIKMSVPHV